MHADESKSDSRGASPMHATSVNEQHQHSQNITTTFRQARTISDDSYDRSSNNDYTLSYNHNSNNKTTPTMQYSPLDHPCNINYLI